MTTYSSNHDFGEQKQIGTQVSFMLVDFQRRTLMKGFFPPSLTYTLHLCCVVFDEVVITSSCREAHWVRTYAACFIFMLKVKNQSAELDAEIPASAATHIVWSVARESCMGPAVVVMMFNRLAHTLSVSCFMFFFFNTC